ncbi:MAG: polyprenyl synthetase family protein [Planctomyces sp.]|nr:polyprenyl synthetase [Planctomycetaceae bacterium]HBC64318.1 polyprenyl synthetase [Planctomycetaceae bacterium]
MSIAQGQAEVSDDEPIRPEFPQETLHDDDDPLPVKKKGRRRSTTHLKIVPETLELRERVKQAAEQYAVSLDRSRAFTRDELEHHGRELLNQLQLPEKYLGFSMVMVGNYFWKQQFLAIPFNRRMLLLPHCLKHAEGCPAEYTQFGLDCERCGACSIADYKVRAEQLGYKVLVAEGSPVVLKIIVSGYIDGILGVACLNVLEKAIDKVLIAGVPSYAVPLHSGDCLNTTLDQAWVWEVLDRYEPLPEKPTASYVPLMRASAQVFEQDVERLLPRQRTKPGQSGSQALAFTERVACDWLANGGKRFRPFMTIAAWYAAAGRPMLSSGDQTPQIPDEVARVAMAIEAFHKASLVHDDIQDDDQYRYGRQTLHRQYGAGQAINIGDYLIGLGYRLIHAAADGHPAAALDVLNSMSTAHLRLCDGQGAEMAFQKSPDWNLSPLDALQIYALKTSPAFEAALYSGLRLADHPLARTELVSQFCRHVGIAFQVLNDLKDWQGDTDNKLVAGQDAAALRPTVLLALALKDGSDSQRAELQAILTGQQDCGGAEARIRRLREIFEACEVFDKAEVLVERLRAKADALLEEITDVPIRDLLRFFTETVLAKELPPTNLEANPNILVQLNTVTNGSVSLLPVIRM